jgi:hypothetical protein
VPASLKAARADPFASLEQRLAQPDFSRAAADFNSALTDFGSRIRSAAQTLQATQADRLKEAELDLQRVPEPYRRQCITSRWR